MEFQPTETAAPAADPATGSAAVPSFAEQMAAAAAAPAQAASPAADPAAAAQSAAAPAAQAAAAAVPDPAAPPAWLQELGPDFKTPDEVKAALGRVKTLEANQLTDELKTSLRLLQEPDTRRAYLQLLDTDFAAMDDEALLLHDFKSQHPTLSAEDVEVLFQQRQDEKYPGLANEEGDPMRRAHTNLRKAEAAQARAKYTAERDTQLATYQQAAAKAAGPTPEETQHQLDAHLANVKALVGKGPDGFQFAVDVNGKPLNLAVEAADLPALEAVLANPYGAFLAADGKSIDYAKLVQFALWQTQGPKFLGLAQKAALEGQGPVVSLGELHNAGAGSSPNQRPAQPLGFAEQLAQQTGGAPARRLTY